nr:hypothetical protein [Tanacetum cinerariifolium]
EGDNDADDDGDDLSEDDADNEDEEESSDSEKEEEEHLASIVPPPAQYEKGESFVVAAARQIRPTLTIAEGRRADGKLIGRLRRERRYFRTVATHYVQEVAHSRDYCARIMDYFQS